MKSQKLGLGGIGVRTTERLRVLRADVVKELMESMAVSGMLHPITVRPKGAAGNGYWLVAGWHRLEAAKKLKWDSIAAHVIDNKDVAQATLVEIDENLIRADLSPAERAAHHARRKEIYETLHPETKPPYKGSSRKRHHDACKGYTAQIGRPGNGVAKARLGRGKRTIQREVARGTAIPDVAMLAGTSLDNTKELDALAKLPPGEQRDLMKRAKAGEKVSAKTRLKQMTRDTRERELAGKLCALPAQKYGVILADPEWRFETWSRETGMDRAADNHYPTSTVDDIKARDVPSISAKDCVLFLWSTVPMNAQALEVMRAWGFEYKSQVAWDKEVPGKGLWFSNQHELLLVGTRGNVPAPAPGKLWSSVIRERKREHSRKPEASYRMIETYFPNLPKIELNCRGKPRPGWEAWGQEADIVEAAE